MASDARTAPLKQITHVIGTDVIEHVDRCGDRFP
jgi:hypothetical protein